jgi:FlaA1/EpsC-like NDP-sugar epimerase
VIPLFHDQIRTGGPVTVTTEDMTRFLISLEQAVDTIFAAVQGAKRGETYIPRVPAARMIDLARALIGERPIKIEITGIRPGEKIDEILISDEERYRTVDRKKYYAIQPILPELRDTEEPLAGLKTEYSSSTDVMTYEELCKLLKEKKLRLEDVDSSEGELLR